MEWFASLPPWIDQSAYFVIFSLLVMCGLGLPLPEEITFLLGGYLVDKIDGHLGLMILMGVSGVLIGDSLLFFLARFYGTNLLQRWPFRLLFSKSRLDRARDFFAKHGSKTVFFAGFFAGIRAPTFFLSSTMGVSYFRFLFWDALRTLLTCPISIWFGHAFGTYAQERLVPYRNWLLGILLLILVATIIHGVFVKKPQESLDNEEKAPPPATP